MLIYLKDGTHLKVTKDLKHDILQKLAEILLQSIHHCWWSTSCWKRHWWMLTPVFKNQDHLLDSVGGRTVWKTKLQIKNEEPWAHRGKEEDTLPAVIHLTRTLRNQGKWRSPTYLTFQMGRMLPVLLYSDSSWWTSNAVFINQKMDMTLSLRRTDVVIHLHLSILCVNCLGGECCNEQHTPDHVSCFWFDVCPAPGQTKVHNQHFEFHSESDVKFGQGVERQSSIALN